MGGLSDDERQPLGGGKTAHGCGPSLVRVILIESVIYLLWAILEIVNAVLKVLELMYRPFDACAGLLKPNDSPKHVVIVGASFGGLAAQRELAGRRDVKVTLIDFKSYFEYTPGVPPSLRASSRLFLSPLSEASTCLAQALRCFVKPSFLSELTCKLPSSRNKVGAHPSPHPSFASS